MNSPVLILFADNNVKIVGTVNQAHMQRYRQIRIWMFTVHVLNRCTRFPLKVSGGSSHQMGPEERYEVKFHFSDSNEGGHS